MLAGDRGGENKTTKIGIFIGNVEKASSPANFLPVAIYPDNDDSPNMKKYCQPVIDQLNTIIGQQQRIGGYRTEWLIKLLYF